eukprot:gene10094-7989_t
MARLRLEYYGRVEVGEAWIASKAVLVPPGDMLRGFLLPEAREESRSRRRGGTPHAYQDSFSQDKEDVNADIVYLHGPYRYGDGTHALYLDGKESRTTRALLQSGWLADKLHIPNSSRDDCAAIQRGNAGVNVYKRISTALLKEMVGLPWVAQFRERNNRGPFSLVYLDYTTTTHRQADLQILLGDKLMTDGVLAIACPYRSPHIAVGRDHHLREEALNKLDICNGNGMAGLSVEGKLAGLGKLRAEVESYAPPGTRLSWLNARTYMGEGKHTQMWVGIYRVSPERRQYSDGTRVHDLSTPAGKEEAELDLMAYWLASQDSPHPYKLSKPLLDEVRTIPAYSRKKRQLMIASSIYGKIEREWLTSKPLLEHVSTVNIRAQMISSWFVSVMLRERPSHRMHVHQLASMDGVRSMVRSSIGMSVVLLPLQSALERVRQENKRLWDFKEYVNGTLAYDHMPSIHASPYLAAFKYWVKEYDISAMRWQGNFDVLEELGAEVAKLSDAAGSFTGVSWKDNIVLVEVTLNGENS